MRHSNRGLSALILGASLLLGISGCAASTELTLETTTSSSEDPVVEEAAPETISFLAPTNCTELLPANSVASLEAEGIVLLRGPGSPSSEPIFVEGQTPEELVGGLSCLYGLPEQADAETESGLSIIVSVAPVNVDMRPGIINDLLAQNLNVGQTTDGALTYWIWGDDAIVPALHNALYEDSWYSALIQPGGRSAYDLGVSLVVAMRSNTSG